jgi:hypothetical protein
MIRMTAIDLPLPSRRFRVMGGLIHDGIHETSTPRAETMELK